MIKPKAKIKLLPLDAARYLTDDAAIAEYLTAVLEADDPDALLLALGDIARVRGMAKIAKDTGLGRESLYKALAPGAKPRFDTVLKVARALGIRLAARAAYDSQERKTARRKDSAVDTGLVMAGKGSQFTRIGRFV